MSQVKEEQPSISHVSGYQIQNVESTPAPWEVYDYKEFHYSRALGVRGSDGVSICLLDGGRVTNPTVLARARADARLIASAPDLLAAAKAALKYIDNLNEEAPTYATCPECTSGSVPDKWNKGLCWIHLLEKAVKEVA